jgi:hypothetical protein
MRGVSKGSGVSQMGCGVSERGMARCKRGVGCRTWPQRSKEGWGVENGAETVWGWVHMRGGVSCGWRVETRGSGSKKGVGGLKGGAGGSRRVAGARKGLLEVRDAWLGLEDGYWWVQTCGWGSQMGAGGRDA